MEETREKKEAVIEVTLGRAARLGSDISFSLTMMHLSRDRAA